MAIFRSLPECAVFARPFRSDDSAVLRHDRRRFLAISSLGQHALRNTASICSHIHPCGGISNFCRYWTAAAIPVHLPCRPATDSKSHLASLCICLDAFGPPNGAIGGPFELARMVGCKGQQRRNPVRGSLITLVHQYRIRSGFRQSFPARAGSPGFLRLRPARITPVYLLETPLRLCWG